MKCPGAVLGTEKTLGGGHRLCRHVAVSLVGEEDR